MRGKAKWEHLNEDLHVLVTVEDAKNRATIKLKHAVEQVKKLLVPSVSPCLPCFTPITTARFLAYLLLKFRFPKWRPSFVNLVSLRFMQLRRWIYSIHRSLVSSAISNCFEIVSKVLLSNKLTKINNNYNQTCKCKVVLTARAVLRLQSHSN